MNVAKNWALTIILIALTLKEQMIIPVKKTLKNAGHIDVKIESILAKIVKKNPAKSSVFYWLFLDEVSSQHFPWNRPIFLKICPLKSFEIWIFSTKISQYWPISQQIFTFFLRKSRKIDQFFHEFAPENPAKFWFFSRKYQKPCIEQVSWDRRKLIKMQFNNPTVILHGVDIIKPLLES